jgi:hypothetical protein
MKRILLLLTLAGGFSAYGQNPARMTTVTQAQPHSLKQKNAADLQGRPLEKTLVCQDTIRYPQAKEQILGTNNFYTFDIWEADNEAFSQTFLNSGSLGISGIEFFGANNTTDGTANVTITASIYNVNASYVPTTLVASGTTTFSSTTAGYHYVSFPTATVTGNYAVVIRATSADGVFTTFVNDALPAQSYDESFAKFTSTYYTSSSGSWIGIPSFTDIGNNNFEPLLAPIVSYSINTAFTATPNPSCLGTPVVFTNGTTPTSILSNRMYNYQQFNIFFGATASDSTYVYDMDNGTDVWAGNQTYTYPAAGTYDVNLYTLGGFWSSCADFSMTTITVNPLPATPVVTPGGPTTFCAGGSVTLTSSAAAGNLWSNGATTQAITVSAAGTYTVTTASGGCTSANSAGQTITVNPLDNASFNYTSSTLCTGGSNALPTVTTGGGTFASTPAGMTINPATGEINMGTTTDGTYSVTYTTAGACPAAVSHNITITAAPDAAFTYAQPTYCTADTDPVPAFGAGASGGTFSSAAGLSLNPSTGAIDLSASTGGTYTVTNTIPAAGVCPMVTETYSVTINQTPTATVSGGGQQCGTGTVPVTITFTGGGPWNFAYFDGTTTTPVTGQSASTYTINAATSGTYTVTAVSNAGCAAAGTGTAAVVINPNPVVSLGSPVTVCDNASPVVLTGGLPAGGTYNGTNVAAGQFDPTAVGAGTYNYTYGYTDANGCSGAASSTITVVASPDVQLATLADLCVYNSPVTLSGGTPAGGTYTGTGVTGGSFDPATAGTGTHVIMYTVTNGNGCTDMALQNLVVDDCLGLEEPATSDENLVVVPNPATDVLTITYSNYAKTAVVLTLTTEDGRLVASRMIAGSADVAETFDVSALAEGLYFVRLTTENGTIIRKVIVQ